MMRPIRVLALCCLLGSLQGPASGDTLAERIARLVPAPREQRWLQIPWRLDLLSAQAEARRSGKPIFMLLMDGHPLGST